MGKNDKLEVIVRDDVSVAIKKFIQTVKRSGLLDELNRRSYYEKPSIRRRTKKKR